jgi:serine/threonine protein kinase
LTLQVLGKGSFGKVLLVKKLTGKDAGTLYALKTLRKDVLIKRNQLAHTRTERSVLQTVELPFLVTLRYAWQVRMLSLLACRCRLASLRRPKPPAS